MKLELCASTIGAIQIAKELNFDRVEVCQNLEQGGMTPSPGFIDYALAYGMETHVLIRPRPGGFFYNGNEIEIMLRDILECRSIGANGIVIGALNEDGTINESAVAMMVDKAEGMDVTFHRAFDDTYLYEKSLDTLISLGVKRVLSTGMGSNAAMGKENLRKMKEYAAGRIEIMAGGGINANNIVELVKFAQPDALHFSGTKRMVLDPESNFSETILYADHKKISGLVDLARSC